MTTFTYDASGNLIRQKDADGKTVDYAYDLDNRLIKTIDGNGNIIQNVYGDTIGCSSCSTASGKPIKTIYPTFTREYGYDKRGRKTLETDVLPDETRYETTFSYDPSGNLTIEKDKEGRDTTYSYDEHNRLVKVKDPLLQETAYSHDNNLISLTDAKGQTTNVQL